MTPLNGRRSLLPGHLGIPVPEDQWARKGFVLGRPGRPGPRGQREGSVAPRRGGGRVWNAAQAPRASPESHAPCVKSTEKSGRWPGPLGDGGVRHPARRGAAPGRVSMWTRRHGPWEEAVTDAGSVGPVGGRDEAALSALP